MGACDKNTILRARPRTDTYARFALFNPVICDQELSYDSTNHKFKVGDGVTAWLDLPYAKSENGYVIAGTNVTVDGTGTEQDPYVINSSGGGGGGGGNEVTNPAKRTALKLGTNWVNPDAGDDTYYPYMTLNIVTGQFEHDYYIGLDSVNTNCLYRYCYEKVDGTLKWTRTIINASIRTS